MRKEYTGNRKGIFRKLSWGWLLLFPVLALYPSKANAGDSLVIQENAPGVCTMDGIVENDQPGYTGDGYANIDDGVNIGMSWSFAATTAGAVTVRWRFALGGSDATSRDAGIYLNNEPVDTVVFQHSDSQSWAEWKYTDTLHIQITEGINTIRLGSITQKGLANIDYIVISGDGLTASECLPAYTLSVLSNDPMYGSISYSPVEELYDSGTHITVYAKEHAGYFFHSWSGEESSIQDTFSFNISRNTSLTALFYENGTEMAAGASGYATVQHDNGTPYLLTGGNSGSTVEPENTEELKAYLAADEPYVIRISRHFTGEGEIKVNSDKTLIGTNDTAHIQGMMVSIADVRNIIIRNVTFSKVVTMDAMELNGAKNIWIDRCEFFTDRDHDKDYYDGLLDIKNESSFITVSRSNFHDHYKSILISSGDDSYQDSVQRITFHHNYFHDCGSRLPSIRFGKAHIFSNFFENNSSAINTRVGACVKVEHNYFLNSGTAIMQTGEAGLDMDPAANIFINSTVQSGIPACNLSVPYPYEDLIDPASALPDLIPLIVRVTSSTPAGLIANAGSIINIRHYPNPVRDQLTIEFLMTHSARVKLEVYNIMGVKVIQLLNDGMPGSGWQRLTFPVNQLDHGIYMLNLQMGDQVLRRKIIKV